jgi:hypothetical protein
MHQNLESHMNATDYSLAMLETKVELAIDRMKSMELFETHRHADALCEAILPDALEIHEEMKIASSRDMKLSEKDHWEHNGILQDLSAWSTAGKSSLLWIGGSSGNQDSWVTELTVDLIEAATNSSEDLTVLSVFCNDLGYTTLSPIIVLKYLIVQFLETNPEIAFKYPRIFTLRRFKRAHTFSQIYRIFEELIQLRRKVLIVIDRIEECPADDDADLRNHLLPCLLKASQDVSIIITSVMEPPDSLFMDERLSHVYIDTGKRAFRRDRR